MNLKNAEGELARWLEVLSSYHMKIEHRAGRKHGNADGLSRSPCKQCGFSNTTESAQLNKTEKKERSEAIDLRQAQEEDKDLNKLKCWLESGTKPDRQVLGCEGYFLKNLVSQWERLQINEGLVMRCRDLKDTGQISWQGIVPFSRRREDLKYSHDIRASGHLGVKKTISRVGQNYYWPGMKNDIHTYVRACEACTKRKDQTKTKRAPMEIVRSGYPMERIAVDILGELPETDRGNRYILVIGDYFTKWVEVHAMPNMQAKTVASVLIDHVISRRVSCCNFCVTNKINNTSSIHDKWCITVIIRIRSFTRFL